MTTRYTVSIHCDRCAEWVEAAPVTKTACVAATLVKQLKRQGWSRVTNSQYTDLCQECLEESRKEKV